MRVRYADLKLGDTIVLDGEPAQVTKPIHVVRATGSHHALVHLDGAAGPVRVLKAAYSTVDVLARR